jgi:hypothetical protein
MVVAFPAPQSIFNSALCWEFFRGGFLSQPLNIGYSTMVKKCAKYEDAVIFKVDNVSGSFWIRKRFLRLLEKSFFLYFEWFFFLNQLLRFKI